ncbi:HTTM domain-containing protein [Amycolatopsis suaedae]|uniref:HTTM domain-containing protein n=1 Tax=Amycolatopsis suaedae TaxID=2510978 RepID=A0A4Q7JFU7_9PSEU|nr:HTTM domain-containing protein [Amycolatopsis suaedae]RZQ65803.1 HTTM domain-containing protein [Amycolatopsis suaedae]
MSRLAGLYDRVTGTALGAYQTAAVRIGVAGTWLAYLIREWPNRHELFGPDGPFSWELAQRATARSGAFSVLLWSDGAVWFEACYLFAIAASVALLLGWRTRTAAILFLIGVLSLQNRNSLVNNGGDNILHLVAIYLTFTRCGQVWSLDARRGRDGAAGYPLWGATGAGLLAATVTGHLTAGWAVAFWGAWLVQALWWASRRRQRERAVLDAIANLTHNAALLVIMAQICLLYLTAGLLKTQGTRWADGTAVYFSLRIDDFAVLPAVSELLSAHAVVVLVLTYATMAVQLAFPFSLVNRRVKNVLLVCLIAEHLGIALLLGLPFFSLAVIAVDLVFAPTSVLRRAGETVARVARLPLRSGIRSSPDAGPVP